MEDNTDNHNSENDIHNMGENLATRNQNSENYVHNMNENLATRKNIKIENKPDTAEYFVSTSSDKTTESHQFENGEEENIPKDSMSSNSIENICHTEEVIIKDHKTVVKNSDFVHSIDDKEDKNFFTTDYIHAESAPESLYENFQTLLELTKNDTALGSNDHHEDSSSKSVQYKPTKRLKYYCKYCDKCYYNKCNKSHNEDETNYSCSQCPKSFPTKIKLLKHEKCHSKHSWFCSECEKSFKTKRSLTVHNATHPTNDNSSHDCKECCLSFACNSDLVSHLQSEHAGKTTKCDQDVETTLKNTCETIKSYSCNVCQKLFNKNRAMKRHMKIHYSDKPHKCTLCTNKYFTKNDLTWHEKIVHQGLKQFLCSECGKCFGRNSELKDHSRVHSGEKIYLCPKCGNSFSHASHFSQHMRLHNNIKPYLCQICGHAFADVSAFARHKAALHSGLKPYVCIECGKTFATRDNLSTHVAIHTGIRPHQCQTCQKSFRRKLDLNRHALIHTGMKPHECEICLKRFSWSGYLKRHMKIHSFERKFHCEKCDKTYLDATSLKKHARLHEEDNPFRCLQCEKPFRCNGELVSHKQKHQGMCTKLFKIKTPLISKTNLTIAQSSTQKPKKVSSFKLGKKKELQTKSLKCPQCMKCFISESILIIHQKTHKFVEKFHQCSVCNESFKTKKMLQKHVALVHLDIHNEQPVINQDD